MLAHVVERGEGTVGLARDDDRLAVAFEGQPVTDLGHLVAATGQNPVRGEDTLAFEFEADGVGVDVTAHPARPVIR